MLRHWLTPTVACGATYLATNDPLMVAATFVLWLIWAALRPVEGPPILSLALTMQWIQVSIGLFYAVGHWPVLDGIHGTRAQRHGRHRPGLPGRARAGNPRRHASGGRCAYDRRVATRDGVHVQYAGPGLPRFGRHGGGCTDHRLAVSVDHAGDHRAQLPSSGVCCTSCSGGCSLPRSGGRSWPPCWRSKWCWASLAISPVSGNR